MSTKSTNGWTDGAPSDPGVYWVDMVDAMGARFVSLLVVVRTLVKPPGVCRTGVFGQRQWEPQCMFLMPFIGAPQPARWRPMAELRGCSRFMLVKQPVLHTTKDT